MCLGMCVRAVSPLQKGSLPFFFSDCISGKNRDVIWSLFGRRKPSHSKIKGLSLIKTSQFLYLYLVFYWQMCHATGFPI